MLCGACDCFVLPSNLQIHSRSRGLTVLFVLGFLIDYL